MQDGKGASGALFRGVYAVDWGVPADEPVTPGMLWRWRGTALRLDGGAPALWLVRPLARNDARPRARSRLRRLSALARARARPDPESLPEPPPGGLVLTDGHRAFPMRLVAGPRGRLAVFDPWLPPPETDLWVLSVAESGPPMRPILPGGLAGGTRVDTPDGPRPVESLAPGDLVLTRDDGPQPVLWRGETRLSGAELVLYPHLRPLRVAPGAIAPGRPEAALRLAPGHRLVVPGLPGLAGRPGRPEALAMAADLMDGRRIRRDLGCGSVSYHHLLLPRHQIIRAEGLACETFHPGLADTVALRWHARGLERACPGLTRAPDRFGAPVRPCLSRAEAALLAAAA